MPDLKFSTIVTEIVDLGGPQRQVDAQLSLLKSVMLERLGVDMSSPMFGVNKEKAALAEVYYGQEWEKLNLPDDAQLDEATAQAMRRDAKEKAGQFVDAVNESLDVVLGKTGRGR